jgi:hypothetical protein
VHPVKPTPIRLSRRAERFYSDQFVFELKVDGFMLSHTSKLSRIMSQLEGREKLFERA